MVNLDDFKLNTAGYIDEQGKIIYVNEYHGEDTQLQKKHWVEFSNTHPEDDTCIRIFKKPTEKQYDVMENIIDLYLDNEGYCKIELWSEKKDIIYYQVFSLYEGACSDFSWDENVGNWTGYKLVNMIKNRANGLREQYLVEVTRQELLNLGRNSAKYKGKNTSRWTAKSKVSVANTVADYNQIDMNRFWKDDILKFIVKVKGETDNYEVTVEFSKLSQKIQGYVKAAKNLFNRDIVTKALMNALSSSDVRISCNCADFRYRIAYQATRHNAKAGEQETRASNITNPLDNLGLCCKHVLAVLNNAYWIRNVASVIVNYANYCKENLEYNYSRFIFPKIYGVQYNQAVQMCMNDFDSDGDVIDELKTSKELINLANAIAKARFSRNKSKADIAQAQKDLEDKEREEQEKKEQEERERKEKEEQEKQQAEAEAKKEEEEEDNNE